MAGDIQYLGRLMLLSWLGAFPRGQPVRGGSRISVVASESKRPSSLGRRSSARPTTNSPLVRFRLTAFCRAALIGGHIHFHAGKLLDHARPIQC